MKKYFALLALFIATDIPLFCVAQESDLNSRLDQHETRITTVEQAQKADADKIVWIDGSTFRAHDRINGLDNKTDTTNNAVLKLNAIQDAQSATLSTHDDQLKNNTQDIVGTNIRINSLKTELETKASNDTLNNVNNTISNVAQQVTTIEGGVNQLKTQTASVEARATHLENQATATEAQAASIEARTGQIENRTDANEAHTNTLDARTTATELQTSSLAQAQATTSRQVETNRQEILHIGSTVDKVISANNAIYESMTPDNLRVDGLNNSINRVDQASIERSSRVLEQSKQYADQKTAELRSEISNVRDEERAGIASITALSAVPTLSGKTFDVGIGMGNFKNSTAVAIGMHYQLSDNNAFKLGIATSNSAAPVVGAGFSYGW